MEVRAPLGSNDSVFNERNAYVAKTVAEINSLFVDQKSNTTRFSNFVIAGIGPLKNQAAESPKLLPLVKKHLLKVIDVGYPFEKGLSEAICKCQSSLGQARVSRETALLKKLFKRIAKDDHTYAITAKDTFEALESRCVQTLILSEKACKAHTIVCITSGKDSKGQSVRHYFHTASKRDQDTKLKALEEESKLSVLEIIPFVDWCIDHAKEKCGVDVELVTYKTSLSTQFDLGFGGIAALTRYEFHPTAHYELAGQSNDGNSEFSDSSSDYDDDDEFASTFG